MRYRNERTGAVIETECRIEGGGWVAEQAARPAPQAAQEREEKKQTGRRKDGRGVRDDK